MTHPEIVEHLEAFALGALPEPEAAGVAAHLERCAPCRAAYEILADTTSGLAESVPSRSPRPALRARLLSAAARERRRPRLATLSGRLPRPAFAFAAALFALVLVGGASLIEDRRRLAAERDELIAIARGVSQAGRWWYMAGVEAFEGSGGTLVMSRREGRAFVLFHDLRPVPSGSRYAIWLIRPDGGWVRAASFSPSGASLQRVDLALQVADFVQCAVTVEAADEGKRAGPLVMQSRILQP